MLEVWRAGQRYRGGDAEAGIDTRHAFSFSGFYEPDNARFGLLVACNEERLEAGAGFAEHPHRDVEIVTWVTEGELTHEDSAGNCEVIRPGDVQRLSAGGGVRHTERNAGAGPLRFVQMWLLPGVFGGDPEYEVVRGIADSTPYALARAEAVLHLRRLRGGERTGIPQAPWVYAHVVRGAVRIGGERVGEGDAVRITGSAGLWAEALNAETVPGGAEALGGEEASQAGGLGAWGSNAESKAEGRNAKGTTGVAAELLIWEMHAEPSYG